MLLIRSCLLLSLAFSATAISTSVRGVNPANLKYYEASTRTFSCIDGSKVIPADQLNDNYCDCADGTDEPGTSACPNSTFYCSNPGFEEKLLPSQFVDDGVCDCCDGTDEPKGRCKNDCYAASAAMRQELKDKALDALAAVEAKRKMIADAAVEKKAALHKLTTIDSEIEQKEAELAQIQEEVARLEEEQKLADEAAEAAREAADAAADAKAEEEEAAAAPVHEEASEHLPEEGAHEEGTGEATEEVDAEELGRRIASQWTHDPEAAGAEEDHGEEIEDSHWDATDDSAPEEEWAGIDHAPEVDSPLVEAQQRLRLAQRVATALKEQKESLTLHTAMDLGPNDMFWHLAGKCFKGGDGRFMYEACFFTKATQSEGSGRWGLGNWEGFTNDYKVAVFSGGEQCWDGPQRSLRLELECGREVKLHSPGEPSTCVYAAKLTTPAACDFGLAEKMREGLAQLELIDEQLRLASERSVVHDEL